MQPGEPEHDEVGGGEEGGGGGGEQVEEEQHSRPAPAIPGEEEEGKEGGGEEGGEGGVGTKWVGRRRGEVTSLRRRNRGGAPHLPLLAWTFSMAKILPETPRFLWCTW